MKKKLSIEINEGASESAAKRQKATESLEIAQTLKQSQYEAFKAAAENGHNEMLVNIIATLKEAGALKEFLKAEDCKAFMLAAASGHVECLKSIMSAAYEEGILLDLMFTNRYQAFHLARDNKRSEALTFLYNGMDLPHIQNDKRELIF